jgi:hypothetical protein
VHRAQRTSSAERVAGGNLGATPATIERLERLDERQAGLFRIPSAGELCRHCLPPTQFHAEAFKTQSLGAVGERMFAEAVTGFLCATS